MSKLMPRWIRLARFGSECNLHTDFRGEFILPLPEMDAVVSISADSDFRLFVDGVEVGGGQFSDYPDRPTATEFRLGPLSAGRHVLSALVWFRGEDFSTYRCGTPGFWCELRAGEFLFGSSTQ